MIQLRSKNSKASGKLCPLYGTILFVFTSLVVSAAGLKAHTAWFIDGYHGGIYGHYPPGYTKSLVEQLKKNPQWSINLEIEPETWDTARVYEPEAYVEFKKAHRGSITCRARRNRQSDLRAELFVSKLG